MAIEQIVVRQVVQWIQFVVSCPNALKLSIKGLQGEDDLRVLNVHWSTVIRSAKSTELPDNESDEVSAETIRLLQALQTD